MFTYYLTELTEKPPSRATPFIDRYAIRLIVVVFFYRKKTPLFFASLGANDQNEVLWVDVESKVKSYSHKTIVL